MEGIVGKKLGTVAARRGGGQCLGGRGLSRRRACVLLPLPRSTFSSRARSAGNAEPAAQVDEVARQHPRYGPRRGWALRRRRGRRVKKEHVHRLWKRAKRQAPHPGHVWTDGFLPDHGLNGTPWQGLTVMDACTREGLALEVATSSPAPPVLTVLEGVAVPHGRPPFIRRDHGPEFIALALRQMQTLDIAPGCPWQNGFGESFHGRVRDEWVNMHVSHSVAEARMVLAASRRQ